MKTKKTNLIILNSLYTVFAGMLLILTILSGISKSITGGNIVLSIILVALIGIMVLGLWFTVVDKTTKTGLIILRVEAILKYVFIILMCVALMMFVLVIQDCANSLLKKDPSEIPTIDRLKAIYIFIIAMVYATSYFIFYNIMLTIVKKDKPNKPLMVIYVLHNVSIIVFGLVLCVINIIKKNGIITELVDHFTGASTSGVHIVGYVFIIIMILALFGALGMSSYILLEKTFKKDNVQVE